METRVHLYIRKNLKHCYKTLFKKGNGVNVN